jgi:amidase
VWGEFVLARRVADLAAVFRALTSGGEQPHPQPPPALGRLRIGLLASDPILGLPLDASCVEAVERAGAVLAELGHDVHHAWPAALGEFLGPRDAIGTLLDDIRAAQVSWVAARLGRPVGPGDLSPEVLESAARSRRVEAKAVAASTAAIRDGVAPIEQWWTDHDVLVTPTMRQPPWPLGRQAGPLECGLFAVPFSFTGQPALSAPLSLDADGLPVGVQLVARRGADELLLALAQTLEDATDWTAARPRA